MAYMSDLNGGSHLHIDQQGSQTLITLSHDSLGHQQSQGTRFETGSWIMPPILLRTAIGLILQVESSQGKTFILIQGNQVQHLTTPPIMTGADILPLQQTSPTATPLMPPMNPMPPMPPMKMGTMEMQMHPMQMRMGDMELHMDTPAPAPAVKRFCSQCGQAFAEGDRFCAQCGHRLQS